jgi:ketosteroid isomerase-like protein
MANPIEVVLKFEQAINAHSPDSICSLMTPDGEFVDSLENRIRGTEKLRSAWQGYFKMVPDYSVSHSEIFADRSTVAIFGSAQGTYVPGKAQNQGEAGSRAEPAAQGAGATERINAPERAGAERQNSWKSPAAWRAVIKDGKVAVWQVYADNEPIRAIMRKYS